MTPKIHLLEDAFVFRPPATSLSIKSIHLYLSFRFADVSFLHILVATNFARDSRRIPLGLFQGHTNEYSVID